MACTLDFRFLDEGLGGAKSKRKRMRDDEECGIDPDGGGSMDVDALPQAKRAALPSVVDPDKPAFGHRTYDGVIAGKASGRKWKQPRQRRASAIAVSRRSRPLEVRNKEKELKKAYKERINGLKEEIRNNKIEKRKKREEREKKKKENVLKSGTKLQKITNPNTLKRIAKSGKTKKLLKVVPDELFNKKSGGNKKTVDMGEQ